METVLSGIRPTGNLHLGNYFGALKNFITMQNEYNCYFFIADLHSLTTHPTPDNLQGNVRFLLNDQNHKVLRFCEIGIFPFKTGSKSYIIYQIMDDYLKGA